MYVYNVSQNYYSASVYSAQDAIANEEYNELFYYRTLFAYSKVSEITGALKKHSD